MSTKKDSTPPWERSPPANSKHTRLSPAKKSAARKRAQRAGRPYPNLVDNMAAARGKTSPAKRKADTEPKPDAKRKTGAKRKTAAKHQAGAKRKTVTQSKAATRRAVRVKPKTRAKGASGSTR